MAEKLYTIRNKFPELSYAVTLNGVELPVLDITHPAFARCTNDKILRKLYPLVQKNAEKNAEKFNKIPAFIKRYFAKHSFAMAELLINDEKSSFASGITTLMMKLGPELIGRGRNRYWDRQVNKGFGAMVIRMRVRDLSKCLAEETADLLRKHPGKSLCFINIAGGAASDSINTLILIQAEWPDLLKNRKIEINVLDTDTFGPEFAARSISALMTPSGRFNSLDISFRHIVYDWNNTALLAELLKERRDWLEICSSEGGLFEYCQDDVIIRNLETVKSCSNDEVIFAGTLLHDEDTVDAGILAALKISTGIKPRFLGMNGLKRVTEQTNWEINKVIEGNPRYLIFALKLKS